MLSFSKSVNNNIHSQIQCFVIWDIPDFDIAPEQLVMSFLNPLHENILQRKSPELEVVTMSGVMDEVTQDARKLYIELVADIGLFKSPDGRSLRQELRFGSGGSYWWYHPVAFRDTESDATFCNLLSILAILKLSVEKRLNKFYLVGQPPGLAECLASLFSVETEKTSRWFFWSTICRAFLGRIKWIGAEITKKFVLRSYIQSARQKVDVVFQGFWPWSVFPNVEDQDELADRYLGALPAKLRSEGKTVGYYCKYEPLEMSVNPGLNHNILEPLNKHENVMMLESQLGYFEIILAGLDFRPLIAFIRIMNLPSFLELFSRNGLNLYPLFRTSLLRGFIGNSIPKCCIVEKSTSRLINETNPNLLITFLEHFPHSRAMYSASRGTATRAWSVQHASYSSGKTFVALHPIKEFDDQPDNQSVPHPDKVFVMGELGKKIFTDCGYSDSQIHVTGSPRYDHVQKPVIAHVSDNGHMRNPGEKKNILVVTSLPAVTELELVQAVVEAYRGLDDFFIITLRAHPFGNFEEFHEYQLIKDAIQVSDVSLKEDLKKADLVIMSQSTVGEEAFLAAKPVWQFRLRYPDQSALAAVSAIPRFYTVSELRSALVMFAESNESFAVPSEALNHVYESLFQIAEKAPSVAIARIISAELN